MFKGIALKGNQSTNKNYEVRICSSAKRSVDLESLT